MADRPLPPALRHHLAADAEQALAEVRSAAVARVRDQLVNEYATALLAELTDLERPQGSDRAADHQPVEKVEPKRAPVDPPASDRAAPDGVWMYAVVAEPAGLDTAELTGVRAEAPVRVVTCDGLVAVVSDVNQAQIAALAETAGPAPDIALIDAVRAHDSVVDAAFRSGPVVPLRFGTVVSDDRAVATVLRRYGAKLTAELERLSTAREWGVTVTEPTDRQEATGRSEPAPTSGAGYLRQRSTQRTAQARRRQERHETIRRARTWLAELTEAASDGPRRRDDGGEVLLNSSFLVTGAAEAEFLRRCDDLAESLSAEGFRLERSGPWPPYHFVSVELQVGA